MTEPFVYVPYVTTEPGDRDEVVRGGWYNYIEFLRELACLWSEYTGRQPKPGVHARCSRSDAEPPHFAHIQRRDEFGYLVDRLAWPNLLSPAWWQGGSHEGLSLTRPARFPNEIGADA